MENLIILLFWGLIIFFIGKWVLKTYFTGPQKDKQIGLYKFDEFKIAMSSYQIDSTPIKGSENFLTFREHISNGVDKIGNIDYSINDYIQIINSEKIHNYYFTVEVKLKELSLTEKSDGYLKSADISTCKTQISLLRNKITSSDRYQKILKLNQLR